MRTRNHLIRLAAEDAASYDASGDDAITIPEDITALADDALATLLSRAVEAFTALHSATRTPATVEAMRELHAAITALRTETESRTEAAAALEDEVAAMAADLAPEAEVEEEDDEPVAEADEVVVPDDAAEVVDAELITAAARPTPRRIDLPAVARRTPPAPVEAEQAQVSIRAAAGVPGQSDGAEMDWDQAAEAFINRAKSFPKIAGQPRVTAGFANIETQWPENLTADTNDAMTVMDYAADENRLPGGSLTAAGGWCAPSEVLYDFCELESRDGLFSLPSINVKRAGIQFTLGPDFRSIYDNTGFCFTEADDIRGAYDPAVTEPVVPATTPPTTQRAGDTEKPCYDVPCPPFQEERLQVCGVCVTSGILQDRAYPELTRRIIRGAVTAHIHRVDGRILKEVRDGSVAVTMPAGQVGATAPLLTSIEIQVEDYKYRHRLARGRSLEAVFPFWVRGVVRADLSRRLGVDLINVSNSQITNWFRELGINPQFVYNWQDQMTGLDSGNGRTLGSATPATAWPTTVDFLLYTAGTWVVGRKPVIELTSVYDSTLFRNNNFTALFTEEAYLVAQRCHDSRRVTVPICGDGATHAGVLIECNGAATPAP